MSTWTKGSAVEKLYCQKLESDGWITKRWQKSRFGDQDTWGVDIIAKRLGFTKWIQVKSCADRIPACLKETLKELKTLSNHCCEHEEVIWAGYNKKLKKWKEIRL